MLVWKFWEIKTKEEAHSVIKSTAYIFYFVAAITLILVFLVSPSAIIDVFLFALFATLLLVFKSRVAAVILAILSVVSLVTTILTKAGIIEAGGKNVFLAIIVAYAGIAAVYATFKLKKLK